MRRSAVTLASSLAAASAVVLSLAGCAAEADTSAESSSSLSLVNGDTLTVCISKNAYAPLYWNDGGTLTGFDVDSITAIADELGVPVAFNEMAFDGLLPALVSERCDVMRSGLYINEERTAKADAIPYLETGPALVAAVASGLEIESSDDLAGLRIAVQAASANERILQELNADFASRGLSAMELSSYPEMPETMAALRNGRVDAVIETDVAAMQAAETLGDEYELLTGAFDADTSFGMYLPQGSELTEKVREVAAQLTADGTFAALAEEYGLLPERISAP